MAIENGQLIGQILLDVGYISPAQLAEARAKLKENPDKRLAEILIELGYINPAKLESGLRMQASEHNRIKSAKTKKKPKIR